MLRTTRGEQGANLHHAGSALGQSLQGFCKAGGFPQQGTYYNLKMPLHDDLAAQKDLEKAPQFLTDHLYRPAIDQERLNVALNDQPWISWLG
jgi:hypothetical protein